MKEILHIDMDQVTCNFAKEFSRICPNLVLGDGEHYERNSLIVQKVCTENASIFHNLEPMEDAIDSIKLLMEKYDCYFLSTPIDGSPTSYSGKRVWLRNHFGDLSNKKLILTHRKDLVIGKYLIDDTHRNGADKFTGEHIHFGSEKFPDWKSVLKYLL